MDNKEKVINLCKKGYSDEDFKYHILPVVEYALLLAKRLNADIPVVEISAYLHDIGRAKRRREAEGERKDFFDNNNHHILGAKETREILEDFGYQKEFINKVEHCVLTHRGRKGPAPETLEAEIIACADAMSHFDTFLDLFDFFLKTTNSFEEAVNKIEEKMDRNWNKKLTLPEAKKLVEEKYKAIKLIISSMKKRMNNKEH